MSTKTAGEEKQGGRTGRRSCRRSTHVSSTQGITLLSDVAYVTALRPAFTIHPSTDANVFVTGKDVVYGLGLGSSSLLPLFDYHHATPFSRTCTEPAPENFARFTPKQLCISQAACSDDATRSWLYVSSMLLSKSQLRSSSGPWLYRRWPEANCAVRGSSTFNCNSSSHHPSLHRVDDRHPTP
jgi:hypothetical protein